MALTPPVMSDNFSLRENSFCSLRSDVIVNRRNIRIGKLGFETASTEQSSGIT